MAGIKNAKNPVGRDRVCSTYFSYAVLTALSAACLLPFLLVLSGSVSEQYSSSCTATGSSGNHLATHKMLSAFRKSCCGPMALRFCDAVGNRPGALAYQHGGVRVQPRFSGTATRCRFSFYPSLFSAEDWCRGTFLLPKYHNNSVIALILPFLSM